MDKGPIGSDINLRIQNNIQPRMDKSKKMHDDDPDIIGSGGYSEDWQRLFRQVPTFSICVSPCSQSHQGHRGCNVAIW